MRGLRWTTLPGVSARLRPGAKASASTMVRRPALRSAIRLRAPATTLAPPVSIALCKAAGFDISIRVGLMASTNWRRWKLMRCRSASSISSSRIMMRSATDLGNADLQVFSKLFDDGLERGQEAEAFSWRQIGGHDDVLEFLVGHLINVEMTRQPAP